MFNSVKNINQQSAGYKLTKSEQIKAKRFTYQQIRKQEKPIESEELSSSQLGKRLVGEKEINESHQVGNLLLKISKQEETIFYLSEQLRSILTQYEVLNEEFGQLKTLLVTNKHITREQILLQSQQPSSQEYQCRQKTLNRSSNFPKYNSNKLPQFKRIKIKEFLKDQRNRKNPYQKAKKKQSEKDADIVIQHKTQLYTVNTLKAFKQEKKKEVKTNLKILSNKRRNLQEKTFQCQNKERVSWLTFLTKKTVEPCHVKLNGHPQSGQNP